MEEDIKILKDLQNKWELGPFCDMVNVLDLNEIQAIENIINKLEQDERVIEEMAKQIEKDTEWYLSDFDGMTVENIIDHFRKKCE